MIVLFDDVQEGRDEWRRLFGSIGFVREKCRAVSSSDASLTLGYISKKKLVIQLEMKRPLTLVIWSLVLLLLNDFVTAACKSCNILSLAYSRAFETIRTLCKFQSEMLTAYSKSVLLQMHMQDQLHDHRSRYPATYQ